MDKYVERFYDQNNYITVIPNEHNISMLWNDEIHVATNFEYSG